MTAPEKESAILDRIQKIPLFSTLLESFHGGILMTIADSVELFDAAGKLVAVAQVNYRRLDKLPGR